MILSIEKFIARIFGGNSYVATFIIAMIPLIELKGAVPFGMSEEIFGAGRLSAFSASMAAAAGSFLPAVVLVLLFKKLVGWLARTRAFGRAWKRLQASFKDRAEHMEQKNRGSWAKSLALILFVALPLPLTGAYTGSAVASFMGLGYFKSLVCILVGNVICALLMALICTVFKGYESYVVLAFLCLVAAAIVIRLLHKKLKKVKNPS